MFLDQYTKHSLKLKIELKMRKSKDLKIMNMGNKT